MFVNLFEIKDNCLMKILITSFTVLISAVLSAQTQGLSPKVQDAFSAEQRAAMTPAELDYLSFVSDNACLIESNPEKAVGLPDACALYGLGENITAHTFNVLVSGIQLEPTEHQYFRLGDTGRTLFIYSGQRMQVLHQRDLARRKNLERNTR